MHGSLSSDISDISSGAEKRSRLDGIERGELSEYELEGSKKNLFEIYKTDAVQTLCPRHYCVSDIVGKRLLDHPEKIIR